MVGIKSNQKVVPCNGIIVNKGPDVLFFLVSHGQPLWHGAGLIKREGMQLP